MPLIGGRVGGVVGVVGVVKVVRVVSVGGGGGGEVVGGGVGVRRVGVGVVGGGGDQLLRRLQHLRIRMVGAVVVADVPGQSVLAGDPPTDDPHSPTGHGVV